MTTAVKRKKLHNFIDTADDKKIKAIYNMIEEEIVEKSEANNSVSKISKMDIMKQASSDPLFLADLKEIREDFAIADNENI
jgi:hypothetical protein